MSDYSDVHIAVKGTNDANKGNEKLIRIRLHLDHAYEKLITYL